MRIFLDIGHPAHVHYFKNFIRIMENKGHIFFITARNKEMTHYLLQINGIEYKNRGKGGTGLISKFLYLIRTNILIYYYAIIFNPDIFLSFSSPYVAQVSWIVRKPHISFTDTEHATLGNLAVVPFSRAVCTPACFTADLGKKQIHFDSYMELTYLHKNYFTANSSALDFLDISDNEKYVIIRFVSWTATHDIGHTGISLQNKIKAIKEFSNYAKVFISSELKLPDQLEKFRINIPYEKMHDVLNYASLIFGESATMASECAVLGTPAIFIDNNGRGYTDEQEKLYSLVYNFSESTIDQEKSIQKGIEILKGEDIKEKWHNRRETMLKDKIDPTAFMVWFIKNYPQSFDKMKNNLKYY
jgi:hypothetical protein